jgi:hypothetical protein
MPDTLDGLVVSVANGDLGNADTSFLYFGLVSSGFNIFSMGFTITATTLTVEASNSAPSIADASAVWSDITDVVTNDSPGGAVTSITATGTLTVAFPLPWSRIRIRRLTTNATNALTINLTRGRFR